MRKEKLRFHVNALNQLLADPQPGLGSWACFYVEHMEAIISIWFVGDSDRKPIHTRDLAGRLESLALFQEAEAARLAAIGEGDEDNSRIKNWRQAAEDNRALANELYEMKAKL